MTLAPAPSLPSGTLAGDVSVSVTFTPGDPLPCTEVLTSPAPLDDSGLLTLLDATIARLTVYRAAYQQARDEDAALASLPLPWHGWYPHHRIADDPTTDREALEWQHTDGDAQH